MKEFLSEEDAKEKKIKLENDLKYADDFQNKEYIEGINWIDSDKDYGYLKSIAKGLMSTKRFIFLASDIDEIKGKPQLIHQTRQHITLIRRIVRERKGGLAGGKDGDMTITHKFIDEPYDKRYDGQFEAAHSEYFWVYKIVGEDDKESYVLSENKLNDVYCTMKGMHIYLDDVSEFSNSMKIKSISNIFLLKSYEANVKIIEPKEIVEMTKNISEKEWFDFLGYHVDNKNINEFPDDVKLLRSLFLLSGKHTNYPLHIVIMGRPGTKKTVGHIETLSSKFEEEPQIIEGANSRIKGLSPSFKEKPANIGDLAKADRIAWIDEIGKMIEFESNKHQMQITNILGELNFLLEHKRRTVSSGNDNGCSVQATAKFLFVTNPVGKKKNLHAHIGLIDPTMMSRVLWWVQDDEETEFALSQKSINENPPHTLTRLQEGTNIKSFLSLYRCGGENIESREAVQTIFDSCYNFTCDLNKDKIQELVDMSVNLCDEPMKSSVWKPRAFHHVFLLLDGIVKHRCLFKDHTSDFKAKKEDYNTLERLLLRIVNSFSTQLNTGF